MRARPQHGRVLFLQQHHWGSACCPWCSIGKALEGWRGMLAASWQGPAAPEAACTVRRMVRDCPGGSHPARCWVILRVPIERDAARAGLGSPVPTNCCLQAEVYGLLCPSAASAWALVWGSWPAALQVVTAVRSPAGPSSGLCSCPGSAWTGGLGGSGHHLGVGRPQSGLSHA